MEIVNLLLEQPTIVVDRVGADQMTPFHYGCRYLVYIIGRYLVYIIGAGIWFILKVGIWFKL